MAKKIKNRNDALARISEICPHTMYCRWKDGRYHDVSCTCGRDDALAILSGGNTGGLPLFEFAALREQEQGDE